MLPDRVSNPGPLTYESGALPIALRGPANLIIKTLRLQNLLTNHNVNRQTGIGTLTSQKSIYHMTSLLFSG